MHSNDTNNLAFNGSSNKEISVQVFKQIPMHNDISKQKTTPQKKEKPSIQRYLSITLYNNKTIRNKYTF